jgi:hypothetical protein
VSNYAYNPITGQLDLVGGGASYIDGVVDNSSLLPVTVGTPALDSVFLAKAGSGLWLISRRPAGLYVRVANNGVAADWTYLGAFPEVNADGNWELYNSTDPTKELKFDLSGLPTGTTRTVTGPAGNGQMMVSGQAGSFTTLTANNGTLTGASAPVLDLAQTWNASGTTFTGLNLSLTNTASASASSYFNINLDGGEAFAIRRGESNVNATLIRCGGSGLRWTARTRTGGGVGLNFADTLGIGSSLEFLATASGTAAGDVALLRDGASDTLAQRRTTNAQTFNIYNTFTSTTNHERGFLKWSSNVFQIGVEAGSGGGSARNIEFIRSGVAQLTIGNTSHSFNGEVSAGNMAVNAAGQFRWLGSRSRIASPANSRVQLLNNASDGFDRLAFGPESSSFPALKVSTTTLQVRLGDDSAFTAIQGKLTTETAYTAGAPTATGYLVVYDSNGTAYKVPAEAL